MKLELKEKQLKELDSILHYLNEAERQNYDEHLLAGGKPEEHILGIVESLGRYVNYESRAE